VTEIFHGITGIFVNPYKEAKKDGVKGFFKGVGTGILGAIISPFSAVLRVGNSLAVGLKNTATFFSKGKLKTNRFRHPRHIIINEPLRSYDEEYAEVQAIIRKIGGLPDNKLIFFADFKNKDPDYDDDICTLIITDKHLLIIYAAKETILDIQIKALRRTEVHLTFNKNEYLLLFFYKENQNKKFIITEDLGLCCQVYGILQKILSS
jgi:hypothetical protein